MSQPYNPASPPVGPQPYQVPPGAPGGAGAPGPAGQPPFPTSGGAAPAKAGSKKMPLLVIAISAVVVLGIGGWLLYQHLFNWGWVLAPAEVKAPVEPYLDELQDAAKQTASLCNSVNHVADQAGMGQANRLTDNPLAKLKVIKSKALRAASVGCDGKDSATVKVSSPCPSLEGISESFTVSVSKQDGFKCMAPNFLGFDDDDRSDCIMWKGEGKDLRVRYESERTSGEVRGKVVVELGAP
jgi:hypothetical protein